MKEDRKILTCPSDPAHALISVTGTLSTLPR